MSDVEEEEEDSDSEPKQVTIEGEPTEEEQSMEPAEQEGSGVVELAGSPEDIAGLYERFEQVKNEVLDMGDDTTTIGDNIHVNKSGWRKIATAFNVSTTTAGTEVSTDSNGVVKAEVVAEASAPNGKTASGVGVCASNESNFMQKLCDEKAGIGEAVERAEKYVLDGDPQDRVVLVDSHWRLIPRPVEVNEHNLVATAETRAKNRAISDLVGGGEVSAEELTAEDVLD